MDISIGANVIGTDGKLGEISDVIAEARTDEVVELVVKHGMLFGRGHTVVPLAAVQRVEDGDVYLNIDRATFERGGEFVSALHGENADYFGPPSMDNEGDFKGHLEFDVVTLSGAQMQGKTMGYPGGEVLTPDDMEEFKIGPGSSVIAADGAKVGELGEFSFAQDTGARTHLSIRTGHLFKHNTEIPLTWVRDLSTHGVILNVTADQVEALIERQSQGSA